MNTYDIPCHWKMAGTLKIEADSLKDAVDIALDPETGMPKSDYFVEESFDINFRELDVHNRFKEVEEYLEERRREFKTRWTSIQS